MSAMDESYYSNNNVHLKEADKLMAEFPPLTDINNHVRGLIARAHRVGWWDCWDELQALKQAILDKEKEQKQEVTK